MRCDLDIRVQQAVILGLYLAQTNIVAFSKSVVFIIDDDSLLRIVGGEKFYGIVGRGVVHYHHLAVFVAVGQ